MSDFKEASEIENNSVVKRRSFLKKSATGAVLVSLPAQSVWGACSVSGAMSGNLSQNTDRHDCEMPMLDQGQKPDFWRGVYSTANFNGFNNVDDSNRESYRTEIKCLMDSVGMALATELYPSPQSSLQATLTNSGSPLENKLAAIFLNSYFGFYGSLGQGNIQVANELVNEILLYIVVQSNQGNAVTSSDALNSLLSLTDLGQSSYTPPATSVCS